MPTDPPRNRFKRALLEQQLQIGLWCTLGSPYGLEVVAGAGFDWLLLDAEHGPNDVLTILPQLQTAAGYPVAAVVRPTSRSSALIKQYLDIGAQTLMIPNVQSAREAREAVAATRYAPEGIRGVAAVTRASRFGRIESYPVEASRELCVIVQVESRRALEALERIAAVDGVDGIFIGAADLAADMGHPGEPAHPTVVAAVHATLTRIAACGKPSGMLATDPDLAERYIELGAAFVAVGVDTSLLARSSDALAARFRRRD